MKVNNQFNYIWDYLIPENNNRTEILTKIISPYLKKNETVLDMVCGFSPLSNLFTKQYNNKLIGFDINKKTIEYCKNKYDKKRCKYIVSNDIDFDIKENIDVLLHLGVSPSTNVLEPTNDAQLSTKLILTKKPRLIILEASVSSPEGLEKILSSIKQSNQYKLVKEKIYKFKFYKKNSVNKNFKLALERKIVILEKISKNNIFSLNDNTLSNLLFDTLPCSQGESIGDLNIGFGFLYYSLARILRPKVTVVFGSAKGFSPICFALGIKDNQNNGKLYFVDVGYDNEKDDKNKSFGGLGFWKNKKAVQKQFEQFGVEKIIKLYIMTTKQFANSYLSKITPIDLMFIDADHTYEGFKYDFETFSPNLSNSGIIACHEPLVEKGSYGYDFGVKEYFDKILSKNKNFKTFKIPLWPGVGLVQRNDFTNIDEPEIVKNQLFQIQQIKQNKINNLPIRKIFRFIKKCLLS